MQEPSQYFPGTGPQTLFGLPCTGFDFSFRSSPGQGEKALAALHTYPGSPDTAFGGVTRCFDQNLNDEQKKAVSETTESTRAFETINQAMASLQTSLPSQGRMKPNRPRPFRIAATGSPLVISAISPAMNSAASLTDDQRSIASDEASSVAGSETSSTGAYDSSGAETGEERYLQLPQATSVQSQSRPMGQPHQMEKSTQPSRKNDRGTEYRRPEKKKVSSVPASQPRQNIEYSDPMRDSHFHLLGASRELDELKEVQTAPIFTEAVREYAHKMAVSSSSDPPFSQYGLLAGDISGTVQEPGDNRIFWNISAPSSFFICGSQGSGKSHTLSCLLENALIPCSANKLPRPLTGIVFHYDTFISDTGGSPCEAAWLSSDPNLKVRVLCPPTNTETMKTMYSRFPNVVVEELRLNESDLNTKRMMDLMAVTTTGNIPLYLHVVNRILRDMRVIQQHRRVDFNYEVFKRKLDAEDLTDQQRAPLKQRLETLESFMVEDQAKSFDGFRSRNRPQKKNKPGAESRGMGTGSATGTDWTPERGTLTIVDLSCPCVTAEMACSLFNICLSLFLEQPSEVGRVITLDEAHKYMTNSAECQTLTEALLATIRLQRHLGARVIISTQEPTISPKLLDLCSVTIVHRFTSPDWLNALRKHLAGVSNGARVLEKALRMQEGAADSEDDDDIDGAGTLSLGDGDPGMELFPRIVGLRVGEALMFAPSAVIGVRKSPVLEHMSGVKRLAHGVMKVRIRNRTTQDGGRSIMAS